MAKELRCEFCSGTESAHDSACPVLRLYFDIIATASTPPPAPPERLRRDLLDRRAHSRILEHSSAPLIEYVASVYDPSVTGALGDEELWPELLEDR